LRVSLAGNALSNKAPVVVFTYRKKNFLKEIFDLIIRYAPPKLYIVHNCASSSDEFEKVNSVRQAVRNFSFSFEVEYIFHEEHLHIKDVVPNSLNRIFSKEERLIVLEDDTIPSMSFFSFCNSMLEKYKDDSQIGCINGCNLDSVAIQNTYFFSGLCVPFWGWATWKNCWKLYKEGATYWESNQDEILNAIKVDKPFFANSFSNFKRLLHTWDIPWNLSLMANSKRCVIPGVNLVTNKGFVPEGTFTDYEHSEFNNLNLHDFGCDECELQTDSYFQNNYEKKILALFKEISPSRKKNKK